MEQRRRVERALRSYFSDADASEDAFDVLYKDAQVFLARFLAARFATVDEAEDIVENIFKRIIENRLRLKFETVEQWGSYLCVAALNGLKDRPPLPDEPPDDPPGSNEDPVDELLRQSLYRLADEVWLGIAPRDGEARRLAAILLYVDGASASEVLELVQVGSATSKPATAQELQGWLSDQWVLRSLAYQQLYVSNDDLVSFLLGRDRRELDGLSQAAQSCPPQDAAVGGWNWGEVWIIFLRYRYGMPPVQALRRLPENTNATDIKRVCDRCTDRFPFVSTMVSLWRRLDGHPLRDDVLGKNPLWKRLVFQYHSVHELPQEDILARVSPAAKIAGASFNHVNAWIGGRLEDELHKYYLREWLDG